jgi:hypothetical protein
VYYFIESNLEVVMKVFSSLFLLFILCSILIHPQITVHIPADYPTIQAKIDVASNGDAVLVAEGEYYENINFRGKAITLIVDFVKFGMV